MQVVKAITVGLLTSVERMIHCDWSRLTVSTMKIGFDAGAGLVGVKCEESSSSTAESNSEDESLKLFIETDAKCSLPLIL